MKKKTFLIAGCIYMIIIVIFFTINQFIYEFSYYERTSFVIMMIAIAIILNFLRSRKKNND